MFIYSFKDIIDILSTIFNTAINLEKTAPKGQSRDVEQRTILEGPYR